CLAGAFVNPSPAPTTSPRLTSTAISVLSRCSAIPVKGHSDSSVCLPLEICPKSPMFKAANKACEAMKPYAMWEIWRTCVRGSGTREPSAELSHLKEAVRAVAFLFGLKIVPHRYPTEERLCKLSSASQLTPAIWRPREAR